METKDILFYDGDCALCNRSVRFIIKHEKKGKQLFFCSLQSDHAKKTLSHYNYDFNQLSTLVLLSRDKIYYKSTAALNLGRFLRAPWSWMLALKIVPRFFRDRVYDIIARNRKKWFKNQYCYMPDEKTKGRFL